MVRYHYSNCLIFVFVNIVLTTSERTYVTSLIPMEAKILFNVAYSYDVIKETAKEVQLKQYWQANEQIQKLQFSSHWVRCLPNRAALRRRKITKEDKVSPSVEQIRAILKVGQDLIIAKGHDECTIFNWMRLPALGLLDQLTCTFQVINKEHLI